MSGAGGPPRSDPDGPEVLAVLELRRRWKIGERGLKRVVLEFGSATEALRTPRALRRYLQAAGIRSGRRSEDGGDRTDTPEALVRRGATAHLTAIPMTSNRFPAGLHDLDDPPSLLWAKGDETVLGLPSVAVVGARRATESGRRAAYEIGFELARSGIVVVSGMALGVDGAAHEGALAGGGLTVAILGSGADRPSPGSHRRLYGRIVESGCVVSEFDPGAVAAPFHFPRRNRVIAALAEATVVVEAALRSGALITVDHALDLGRSVHAVPGPIDRAQSAGTNALIRDGAAVVTSAASLADELGRELSVERAAGRRPGRTRPVRTGPTGSTADGATVDTTAAAALRLLLDEGPTDLDELTRRSGLPARTVASSLVDLELRGEVRTEGARFRRTRR